jgi:hypothetical protein
MSRNIKNKYSNIFAVPKEVINMPKPEKRFQAGAIEASIFDNEIQHNGKTVKIKEVAFQKRYKSADGSWKSTSSLDINDLPRGILSKAYEHLVLNPEVTDGVNQGTNGETE